VFFWAKNIVPGTWDEPTSHPDIVPTLLSLYGLPLTDDLTGMPVGTAPPDRALDGVAVARLGVVQSMVQDGWKLIYRWSTGEYQLYDTVSDPQELTDLYTDDEPHAVALKALLAPRVEALQPLAPFYTPH
jgi:arylsulfatase A-like enzyme